MFVRCVTACLVGLLWPLLVGASAAAPEPDCMAERPSTLPVPPARVETLNGRPTIRYMPPHPRGVVYVFHGSGGSETFATRPHTQRVLSALIAAGYGYASAPSLDRTAARRWNLTSLDPAANPDVAYMLSLHKALIARGDITAETPVFTMGMSNGGGMANLYAAAAKAQGLPVTAVADYMGSFPAPLREAVPDPHQLTPTLVILSHNDGLVSAERVGAVAAELSKAGAAVELHVNPERRVCAATFALLPDMTAAQREALVHKTLTDAGVIDANGDRLMFRDKAVIGRDEMAELAKALPEGRQGRQIMDELLIAWAGHQMRSEFASRQVEFFDAAAAAARRGRKTRH